MGGSAWRCVVLGAVVAGVGGCSVLGPAREATHPEALRFGRGGYEVEYVRGIDRYTFYGPEEGPNLLHVVGLERGAPASGDYVFYGGCYTWVSPQAGESGWVGPEGGELEWPPDPAMDRGPGVRTARSLHSFTVRTPVDRRGLREVKTFTLREGGGAELEVRLENTTGHGVLGGVWVNTAVDPAGKIALRAGDGAGLYGWDERSVDVLMGVLGPADEAGWRVIDVGSAGWSGGIKVYLEGSSEIAVWREGYWLHRSMSPADTGGTLRDYGEGPVAVYLQPDAGIAEAELYAPLEEIGAGLSVTAVETWTVIESEDGGTSVLP